MHADKSPTESGYRSNEQRCQADGSQSAGSDMCDTWVGGGNSHTCQNDKCSDSDHEGCLACKEIQIQIHDCCDGNDPYGAWLTPENGVGPRELCCPIRTTIRGPTCK